jgi:hypothetical protein
MTPERFRQVRNLFEAALEKQPAERDMFVCEAAQSDEGLRAEVERMLDAHQRTVTFLDGSVAAPMELRTDPRRIEGRRLGPVLREHREQVTPPMSPRWVYFVGLGQSRQMTNRPGDHVAIAVQISVALPGRAQHARDVSGDRRLFGQHRNGS